MEQIYFYDQISGHVSPSSMSEELLSKVQLPLNELIYFFAKSEDL